MKKTKDWFKDRGYPHLSNKTPLSQKKRIERYISNPKNISSHSFLPLLFKEIKQRRFKPSNFEGIERRSHKKLKNGKVISNTKVREILYASHIDAHIYSYYSQNIITPKYEEYLKKSDYLSDSITAYRQLKTEDQVKFKNNIHFAKDIFDEVKKRKNCVVLAFDIENFFPSLNHKKLKLIWAKILGNKTLKKDHYNIFKAVTRFSFVKLNDLKNSRNHFDEKTLAKNRNRGKHMFFEKFEDFIESGLIIHKNQKKDSDNKVIGIPQGLPISALLANLYMLPFDEAIVNKLSKELNVFYRRYSDDIIVICEENQIKQVEAFVLKEITNINLIISKEKTEKTLFKQNEGRLQSYRIEADKLIKNIPLNYLGFEFYGYQTLVKSKNLAAFYREMKLAIKRKHKRVEKIKEKHLLDNPAIFKRKIYRLYSYKGVKKRMLPAKRTDFINGQLITKRYERKFRGNYIKYIYRASEEMEAPEIKRQVRNHWKILQSTIKKYEFSNTNRTEVD